MGIPVLQEIFDGIRFYTRSWYGDKGLQNMYGDVETYIGPIIFEIGKL